MDSAPCFPENQSENFPPLCQSLFVNPISELISNNLHASGRPGLSSSRSRASSPVFHSSKFTSFRLLDEEIILHIQNQQSEINQFIARQAEKLRFEVEERRKTESRMLVSQIHEGILKKLQEKENQIQRMRKLNEVLEERLKSISTENQLLRDLAHANEAMVNSLRTNIEQALAQTAQNDGGVRLTAVADEESCCGSADHHYVGVGGKDHGAKRLCRRCGTEESSVVLLPCRHLCLCGFCALAVYACPQCNSIMEGSVNVNTTLDHRKILPPSM